MHSVRRDRIIAAKGLPDGGICYELYRRKEKKGVFKEVDDVPYRRGCNDGGRIGVACGNFCSEQKNIKRLDCQKGRHSMI